MEPPIDLADLARRLSGAFPSLVTLSNDASAITDMGRVEVTSNGTVGGAGPVAERVRAICEEYIKEQSLTRQATNSAPQKGATNTRNPFRRQHCGHRLTNWVLLQKGNRWLSSVVQLQATCGQP